LVFVGEAISYPERETESIRSCQNEKNFLATPDVSFVSLQYGDCGAEIVEIEKETGIEILR